MRGDRSVEGGIQTGMIRDVDDLTTDVVASVGQAGDLGVDRRSVDVEDRHGRAVLGEGLDEAQSDPARAPVTTTP